MVNACVRLTRVLVLVLVRVGLLSSSFRYHGVSACAACAPGLFVAASGSSVCEDCPLGTHSVAPGMSACEECEEGWFCPRADVPAQRCALGCVRAFAARAMER